MIMQLMQRCERDGEWPEVVKLVIIVLTPKSDGGFRPIGLLPLLPRTCMRTRRDVILEWDRLNDRPYLYGGGRKKCRGCILEAVGTS